ncbi:DUF1761 domain-containing protein [Candidatus Woesearchaeota archaeon]|nr:DUF1761 domain-containing protein [Candidatus Woesearchaeota archaeon]
MLQQIDVNYLAVLAAAIASMIVGFIWYGPLFGKMWMKMMGFDKKKMDEAKKKGMGKTYALAFLTSLIMSYVLAHFVGYVQAATAMDGVVLGFWVWIGFLATTQIGSVLWEGKPVKLYLINTLHYLVALAVMAAILAVWV